VKRSLEEFVAQVAQRGSWFGGGSAAASTAAVAAALLEKLLVQPARLRQLRRIRRECLRLVDRDATAFAGVIQALRSGGRERFRRALGAATAVQVTVLAHAQQVQAMSQQARRVVSPKFQSDLRCAQALAKAAADSAKTLIQTNRAWLRARRATG